MTSRRAVEMTQQVDVGDQHAAIELVQFTRMSTRSRLVNLVLWVTVYPFLILWSRVPFLPWPYRLVELVAVALPAVRGMERRAIRLDACSAEWMSRREEPASVGAILYLHGGAFLVGGIRTHRRLLSRVVKNTGISSLAVDYRMLPKHPIGDALEDCLDGYRWLLGQGHRPEDIAVAGDSAGGYFAMMVALMAHEQGLGAPGAVVCQSPLIDLDPAGKLARHDDSADRLFPAAALTTMASLIDKAESKQVRAGITTRLRAPIDFEFGDMPPVLIQVGAEEILRPDAELLARSLSRAGIASRLELWEGQCHVFQAGADFTPEGRKALARSSAFIADHIGARRTGSDL